MRGELAAGEFLGQPMGIVAHQDIEAIAVEGQRQAVLSEHALQERGVAVHIFGRPEVQGQDLAGGIIDGPQQHQRGPAPLEPREGAAVDLHEGPARGLGHASVAARRGPPRMAGRPALLAPQTPDGLATEDQAVLLAQFLGQMAVVEAHVARGHQAKRRRPRGARQAAGRGPAPIAMSKPAGPRASKRRLSRRTCRRLSPRACAACRVVIRPAQAAFTSPGRCSSFRLNVKVSMVGGPFHVAVTPGHFHVATAAAGSALDIPRGRE